jgi:hypothetical protein
MNRSSRAGSMLKSILPHLKMQIIHKLQIEGGIEVALELSESDLRQ